MAGGGLELRRAFQIPGQKVGVGFPYIPPVTGNSSHGLSSCQKGFQDPCLKGMLLS